jgi:hypothetical protein
MLALLWMVGCEEESPAKFEIECTPQLFDGEVESCEDIEFCIGYNAAGERADCWYKYSDDQIACQGGGDCECANAEDAAYANWCPW